MGVVIPERDDSGRSVVIPAVAPKDWKYEFLPVHIKTAEESGLIVRAADGSDITTATITLYKDDGGGGFTVCTNQADADLNCIRTVIDWEHETDIVIIAGKLFQRIQPTSDVFVGVVAVPDIPAESGGSIPFVNQVNMRDIPASYVLVTDGRSGKRLNYDATYHTNKFRTVIDHEKALGVAVKHNLLMTFEFYHP